VAAVVVVGLDRKKDLVVEEQEEFYLDHKAVYLRHPILLVWDLEDLVVELRRLVVMVAIQLSILSLLLAEVVEDIKETRHQQMEDQEDQAVVLVE
jgi:hypothetical protein|tara:strand:- start:494 stop:778 length:285 start_codon:yes stop_codon:yes gene_type:complete